MKTRRVVTGKNASGKSVVLSDGHSPRETAMKHTPGFVAAPLWKIESTPDLSGRRFSDPMATGGTLVPPAGGSVFMVVTFPPDSVMMSPDFKPELAGPEHLEVTPGIAHAFEPDNPGMHTTPTIDYVCILEGEIILELDDGATVELKRGDTVVQQGVRHAWRNPGTKPATIVVALLGAKNG